MGFGVAWPVLRISPRHITLFLREDEVFEEAGGLVGYFAVEDGELNLVEPEHPDARSVDVSYNPDSVDAPTNFYIEFDLDSLGARTLGPGLALEALDPLTGIIRPAAPYDPPSSGELGRIVSNALQMTQTIIGNQLWCLIRPNRSQPPEWHPSLDREDQIRWPEGHGWMTRVFDKFNLSPGLQGPRMHCRYFESITREKECAFALHVENLDWWQTLKSASTLLFRQADQRAIKTHEITSWHIGRDGLVERLKDLGQSSGAVTVAPAERIQGCDWDGVAVAVVWDGQEI